MEKLPHVDASAEIEWLSELDPGGEVCGFDASGWIDSIWILNAMYENTSMPSVTYEEDHQTGLAEGRIEPLVINGVSLDETSVMTGGGVGYAHLPPKEWTRLRWSVFAERTGVPLGSAMTVPPCFRWFPGASWPISIIPPTEGSLDEASLRGLLPILAAQGPLYGVNSRAFFGMAVGSDYENLTVYSGSLRDMFELVERGHENASPSNFWPHDRSWFAYTDWDLSATKISGSRELIAAIEASDALETLRWEPPLAG